MNCTTSEPPGYCPDDHLAKLFPFLSGAGGPARSRCNPRTLRGRWRIFHSARQSFGSEAYASPPVIAPPDIPCGDADSRPVERQALVGVRFESAHGHKGPVRNLFSTSMYRAPVAKFTHAGLPWLRYIRLHEPSTHFWPFDGWDMPAGRSVVAEVYPSLWRRGFAREDRNDDQHDAFSVAEWMRRSDLDGTLI